jgi:hypothetical protein
MKMGTIASPWRYDATFNFCSTAAQGTCAADAAMMITRILDGATAYFR